MATLGRCTSCATPLRYTVRTVEAICVASSCHVLPGSETGKGVFAVRKIVSGEALMSVDGPVTDFLATLAMGEAQCYALQFGPDAYYDLDAPARWANHACDPNCGIRACRFVALHDIAQGEELTWDYSTTMDERYWTMQCQCGSPTCRGVVDDFRTLPAELRQRYLDLGIVMPFIAEQYR